MYSILLIIVITNYNYPITLLRHGNAVVRKNIEEGRKFNLVTYLIFPGYFKLQSYKCLL